MKSTKRVFSEHKNVWRSCAPALVALGVAAHGAAAAQEAAPKQDEGLQTVVVTAQKRPQAMQDVPVAVSTIDARAIENKQVADFNDLPRIAPSMTVNENPNNNSITLRGIGTFVYSPGIESAVSVIVDDVPVIQQMQAFANLSDIDHIEVLRGPQGTLYGKNSSAGLINIVTRAPSEEREGSVQGTYTSDGERRLEASVSGPINGRVGYRLNAYAKQRRGDVENLYNHDRLNGDHARGLRARVDFKLTDDIQGRVVADYNARRVEGPVTTLLTAPPDAKLRGLVPLAPAIAGITPGPDNRKVAMDNPGYSDSKDGSLSASLSWRLGEHTLTSVTTWQDWHFKFMADYDMSTLDLQSQLTKGVLHGGITHGGPVDAHMATQELRLASNGERRLNYLGGLYFADSVNNRDFKRGPTQSVADWFGHAGNRSAAAFGQADYKITPETRVNAGLRYNHEHVGVDFTNRVPATPVRYMGTNTDNAVTGKLALQHDFAKAVMGYVSYATGYKGAGYDVSTGFDQTRITRPVLPETSKSYEIGVKSRFLNNRLQLNAAVFDTDYDNFQAQGTRIDPVTNLTQNAVMNVGKMRTRGAELEVAAKPVGALLLEGSLAWIDAKVRSYPTAFCYPAQTVAQGCHALGTAQVQDLAGKPLSNAPKLKYTLSGTYNFPVGETGYSGVANLNWQHQSAVNYDLANNPLTVQNAYGILNGSIAVSDPTHDLKVTLFANNLLNKTYSSFIGDNYSIYTGSHVLSQTLPRNSQRYVGVRVRYEF
jgi:iron complex outermembrane receptor protein